MSNVCRAPGPEYTCILRCSRLSRLSDPGGPPWSSTPHRLAPPLPGWSAVALKARACLVGGCSMGTVGHRGEQHTLLGSLELSARFCVEVECPAAPALGEGNCPQVARIIKQPFQSCGIIPGYGSKTTLLKSFTHFVSLSSFPSFLYRL